MNIISTLRWQGSLYLSVWKIKFSKLQQKLHQYCVQIKLRFYLQMRRNITKDQSIYPFCYFPIDLKGWAIGNKSYNTYHFNGENGKWQLSINFIYSEKATKFCEIFTLLLSYVVPVQSKVKILQNVVAFSEYMNFHKPKLHRYCFQVELRLNHITKDQSIFNFCYFLYLLKALAIRNKSYNTVHFIIKKIQMKWKALMNGSPLGILHVLQVLNH